MSNTLQFLKFKSIYICIPIYFHYKALLYTFREKKRKENIEQVKMEGVGKNCHYLTG